MKFKIKNLKLKNYKSNKTYKTYRTHVVLFVLLFSFFIIPTKPTQAATLSRPPSNLNLVGYWPLDEGNGSMTTDASGNGHTGTIYNGTAWTNGTHGKALDFNQPTTYPRIGVADSAKLNFGTGDFSISMWGKHRDFTYPKAWFMAKKVNACFNAGNVGWDMGHQYFSTGMEFCMNDGTNIVTSNAVFDTGFQPSQLLNKWVHLTAVIDRTAGRVKFYVNGVKQTNEINISSVTGSISNNYALDIGTLYGWETDGVLDDIKIYNRALTASEISKTYSSGQITRKQTSSSGLVGYWSMDDNAGNKATDSSGNNNVGTIIDATWTNGPKGKALNFNGSSAKISGGNVTVATTMTIAGWIKKNTSTSQKSFFSNRGGSGAVYFGLDGTKVFLYDNAGTAPNITSSSGAVKIGEWQHVVATSNGATTIFYVNGAQVLNTGQARTSSTGTFGIGWDPSIGSEYWDGLIDDVRVYNRALTPAEIQSLYKQNQTFMNTSQVGKLTNGLVGHWSFNGKDVSGNIVYDRSGQGNNGTTTGTTLAIGKSGQAMGFNGINDYVEIPNHSSLNPNLLTLSVWAKSNTTLWNDYGFIVSKRDAYIIHPNQSNKSVSFYIYTNTWVAASCTPNIITDWTLYTLTWDGTNLKCFIDGTQAGVTVPGGSINTADTGVIQIGRDDGLARYFNGAIDEVRIYNRALAPLEVQQLYNMGR